MIEIDSKSSSSKSRSPRHERSRNNFNCRIMRPSWKDKTTTKNKNPPTSSSKERRTVPKRSDVKDFHAQQGTARVIAQALVLPCMITLVRQEYPEKSFREERAQCCWMSGAAVDSNRRNGWLSSSDRHEIGSYSLRKPIKKEAIQIIRTPRLQQSNIQPSHWQEMQAPPKTYRSCRGRCCIFSLLSTTCQ